MTTSFKDAIEKLVNARIKSGGDPIEIFEELSREANQVFGHYDLEYELTITNQKPESKKK